jgi:branched-chain amino acid transport system permease protein
VGTAQGLDSIAAAELAPLVYGTVMILVILLAPAGLVGSLLRWRAARAARGADRRTTPPAARPTDPHHPDGPADQQRRPVATTKGDQP